MFPANLRYAPSHEWALVEGDTITVGITKFAVEQLTDVVFLELPKVGARVAPGKSFGVIESVKAVSDLYAPVAGEVVAVNQPLANDPGSIADDAYGKGWMIKIKPDAGAKLDGLLTAEQYQKQVESEAH